MDSIGPEAIRQAAASSDLRARYGQTIDRESAYEMLGRRLATQHEQTPPPPQRPEPPPGEPPRPEPRDEPSMAEKVLGNPAVRSFLRSAASALGREITRGIFGTRRRSR
jgi:hypothetical protein